MNREFDFAGENIVIVLGAGATISDMRMHTTGGDKAPPPSDGNFLQIAEIVAPKRFRNFRREYEKYYNGDEVYPLDKQRMEQVFASIFIEMSMRKGSTAIGRRAKSLYDTLVILLRETINQTTNIAKPKQLFQLMSALSEAEVNKLDVVSFNYDMFCERALLHCSKDGLWRWRPGDGYGFSNNQPKPKEGKSNIVLHKMHGSMNWYIPMKGTNATTAFNAKKNIYIPNAGQNLHRPTWMKLQTCQGRDRNKKIFPLLVPPVFDKASRINGKLEEVWSKAKSTLFEADTVIFWGYSLPAADYHAELLFAQTARKKKYNCIAINPDLNALNRITQVAGHSWNRWFFDIDDMLKCFPEVVN